MLQNWNLITTSGLILYSELRAYWPQHCWNQLWYSEESWRPAKTCYHSNFSENTAVKTSVKNSQGIIELIPENETLDILRYFEIRTDDRTESRRPNQVIIKEKRKTWHLVDFAVLEDFKVNMKEKERKKYLDLAWELKKLWNMKVMVIPVIVGALGTVPKGLERGLTGLKIMRRIEIIQTTVSLKTATILRRVLEAGEEFLSLTPRKIQLLKGVYKKLAKKDQHN